MRFARTLSSERLGLAGSTAVGTEAGPLRFLGSQTPTDPGTGELACRYADLPPAAAAALRCGMLMVDAPDERILVQTWRILANVESLLADHALGLGSVVHQRFFLRDPRDLAGLERAVRAYHAGPMPSTTIVVATGPGVNRDIAVHADFVALSKDMGEAPRNVSIPELDPLTAPYPLATRAGPFVFTSPLPGVDLATGRIVAGFAELSESERALAQPPYTPPGEAAAAQQVMIFRHIDRILRTQGSSLAWQLRQNGWMRLAMREFGPASRVRRRLFEGANVGPFTSLQVSGLRHADALFEYGVIALVPPADPRDYRRALPAGRHGIASYYVGAVRAGPYVVSAGEVPVDTERPGPVRRFGDLRGDARMLGLGRIHAEKPVMAEAHFVYTQLAGALSEHGASMSDVVHQTVYMVDVGDYPALERIATLFFGARMPPTTLVPIVGTSPYEEAGIEIEAIAYTGDEGTHAAPPPERTGDARS